MKCDNCGTEDLLTAVQLTMIQMPTYVSSVPLVIGEASLCPMCCATIKAACPKDIAGLFWKFIRRIVKRGKEEDVYYRMRKSNLLSGVEK